MTRVVDVELRSSRGRQIETIDVGLTATDDAAVDMARRQAGISADEFETGVIVA